MDVFDVLTGTSAATASGVPTNARPGGQKGVTAKGTPGSKGKDPPADKGKRVLGDGAKRKGVEDAGQIEGVPAKKSKRDLVRVGDQPPEPVAKGPAQITTGAGSRLHWSRRAEVAGFACAGPAWGTFQEGQYPYVEEREWFRTLNAKEVRGECQKYGHMVRDLFLFSC